MADLTSSVVWTHTDSRGLGNAIAWSQIRLATANFTGRPENLEAEARDVRAAVAASLLLVDWLSTRPPMPAPDPVASGIATAGDRFAADFNDPDRARAAAALLATWKVLRELAVRDPIVAAASTPPDRFQTNDGNPPTVQAPPPAMGWEIVAGIGIAIVAVSAASAWCFSAFQSKQIAITLGVAAEQTKQMQVSHANAMAVLEKHIEAEKLAGKQLPISDVEKAVLGHLETSQKLALEGTKAAVPEKTGGSWFDGLGTVGVVLVAGLIAVVVMKGR